MPHPEPHCQKTKMDCWFVILNDREGKPYIYDLEGRKKVKAEIAVRQLMEGVEDPVSYDLCELGKEEDKALRDLAKRCGALEPPAVGEGKRHFEIMLSKANEDLEEAVSRGEGEDVLSVIRKRAEQYTEYLSHFYGSKKA